MRSAPQTRVDSVYSDRCVDRFDGNERVQQWRGGQEGGGRMSQRARVLSLYRSIVRLGRNWTSAEGPEHTADERRYILQEARELFRKNKQVSVLVGPIG